MLQKLLSIIFITGICVAFVLPCFSQIHADSNSAHHAYILAHSPGNDETAAYRWTFPSIPNLNNANKAVGKVTINITINPDGRIAEARFDPRHTTLRDTMLINKCEAALKGSKLAYSGTVAPASPQRAQIVFRFDAN